MESTSEAAESEVKPVQKWKNQDVLEFLELAGMSELVEIFKRHRITGKDLVQLTEKELKQDLLITELHLRKKLMRHLMKMRSLAGIENTCKAL